MDLLSFFVFRSTKRYLTFIVPQFSLTCPLLRNGVEQKVQILFHTVAELRVIGTIRSLHAPVFFHQVGAVGLSISSTIKVNI